MDGHENAPVWAGWPSMGRDVVSQRLIAKAAKCGVSMSRDAAFIKRNRDRLIEIAEYLLDHRDPKIGLVRDGYGFDVSGHRVSTSIQMPTGGVRSGTSV